MGDIASLQAILHNIFNCLVFILYCFPFLEEEPGTEVRK